MVGSIERTLEKPVVLNELLTASKVKGSVRNPLFDRTLVVPADSHSTQDSSEGVPLHNKLPSKAASLAEVKRNNSRLRRCIEIKLDFS